VEIAGLGRTLPFRQEGCGRFPDPSALNTDPEYIAAAAEALSDPLAAIRHDLLVTVAWGGLPITRALAERLDRPYRIAHRKEPGSPLHWAAGEASDCTGRRVIVVDDWMRTGQTLAATRRLLRQSAARIVAAAAICIVGDPVQWRDVVHLAVLPQYSCEEIVS
jgi:adenine/guanine phosphoribosyltransferase-like PRPP-binding protein